MKITIYLLLLTLTSFLLFFSCKRGGGVEEDECDLFEWQKMEPENHVQQRF